MDESEPGKAAAGSPSPYEFGAFRLDPVKRLLTRDGDVVPLSQRALDLLVVLVENRGRTLDKDELMRAVWPDTVVEENNLARSVSTLRRVLGEAVGEHRYVVTIPGRGYRFVAPVREVAAEGVQAAGQDGAAEEARGAAGVAEVAARTGSEETEGVRAHTGAVPAPPRRRVLAGWAAALALLAAAAGWQVWRTPPAPVVRSLAVLPFDDLSAGREQEYLADGITDALIAELTGIRSLRVISRQSIMRYRDSTLSAPEIARELGVDALVEGTTLRSGERVRVTAQLVHGPSDRHLWAATHDRDLGDVLALQADIAQAVAREVRAQLTAPERARLARRGRIDPEAYDLFLRGRWFFHRRGERGDPALFSAVKHLERAIARDPQLAEAHATLAFAYRALAFRGTLPPWEAAEPAERHARRALELDPALADAHTAAAAGLAWSRWEWAAAEEHLLRALELEPGNTHARLWYSLLLLHLRRFEESRDQSALGLRTDPFHPLLSQNHVEALAALGRWEEALAKARDAVEAEQADPDKVGWLLLRLGRLDEALAEFERAGSKRGIARVRARRGDPSGLREELAALEEKARSGYVSPMRMASLHAALGEPDRAFAQLEEAHRTRTPSLADLAYDPEVDPLRGDPRFADLLRRINLPR